MKNGKGIKVIIVLVVVIALVVIGGVQGDGERIGNRCNDRDSGRSIVKEGGSDPA